MTQKPKTVAEPNHDLAFWQKELIRFLIICLGMFLCYRYIGDWTVWLWIGGITLWDALLRPIIISNQLKSRK